MRAALGVAGTLVLGSLLASCGEKQEPAGGPPPPTTRAQYVKRANAICLQLGREIRELAERSFGAAPPTGKTLRDYEQRARALQQRRLAQLRALPPPPGDQARLGAIYDAWEAVLRDLARVRDRPGVRPPPSVERFRRLAGGYGLRDCAGAADGP